MNTETSTDSLRAFLERVRRLQRAEKEETFFSIGGRGYFENPTSDLLGFFLADRKHGLHPLFLGVFLECLGLKPDESKQMVDSTMWMKREVETDSRNRIDLVIHGEDWLLMIENKVRHWVANPLEDYVRHAETIGGSKKRFFAILSPGGDSPSPELWKPVTYRDYVDRLRSRIELFCSGSQSTKWHLLAREFILHMDQEICQTRMTDEEIQFVEQGFDTIKEVKNLSDRYLSFVDVELRKKLEVAKITAPIIKWLDWGFWIRLEGNSNWQFGLSYPGSRDSGSLGFDVMVWCRLPDTVTCEAKASHFPDFEEREDEEGFRTFLKCFDNRERAVAELCRIAGVSAGLLPKEG